MIASAGPSALTDAEGAERPTGRPQAPSGPTRARAG